MPIIENAVRTGKAQFEIIAKSVALRSCFYFTKVPNTNWIFAVQINCLTEEANHSTLLTQLIMTAVVTALLS
ncbi:hypothetical protein O9929_20250 [Vibrio lentus]|nr:hypothetical protein [Vibrio lentus]